MPHLDPGQLKKRATAAWAAKESWRDLYEDAYEYGLPQRNLYDGSWESDTRGQKKGNRVFDSTAVHAVQRFANRMQSGLFPPDKRWMTLQPGSAIPEDREDQVRAALQIYTDRFFDLLRSTNFDLAMGEYLLDLCVGTAAMMIQPGDDLNRLNFTPVPPFLLALEEGPDGQIQNVFRKVKVPAENIKRMWPDAKISSDLKTLIKDKPSEAVNLQEATIFDPADRQWRYYVWSENINNSGSEIVVKREIRRSPWIISRFMKVSNETMGRGPLIAALSDIRSLNKTIELLLKNASINIAGVYTAVDDGVLNPQTIRIAPGSIVPVAANGGPRGPSLIPLPRSGDIQLSQIILQDLRMSIKRMLLDDSLPPDNMSARSATEIVERMQALAINLSSSFGRQITETMVPLVRLVLNIMGDEGLIELPLRVDGLEVQIVPVSPRVQAQNFEEVQKVMQWLTIVQQLGPEGMVTVKMGEIADWVAEQLGVPSQLRTDDEERAQIEQEAAAMMEAQMQQQLAAQQAEGGAPMPPGEAPPPPPPG